MPILASLGAGAIGAYRMFRGGAAPIPNYIEEVFSTYLYTGTGSSQTITNGIDLSGKGGLVWIKSRSAGFLSNVLTDTVRGNTKVVYSNLTAPQDTTSAGITSFNSNGFSLGVNSNFNEPPETFVSWTFREQAKFFDVVTYTGTGSARTVAHNLGSVPGCIIVKRTDSEAADNWQVYHRSLNNTQFLNLNTQFAVSSAGDRWNSTTATDTVFSVGTQTTVNASGGTFVAYLFAHNAGGFGLTGTDNVVSCGSYTGNGSTSGPTINLGYEPQWLLIKRTDGAASWFLIDNMRGFVSSTAANPSDAYLVPDTTAAESTWGAFTGTDNAAIPLATGFQIVTSALQLNINAGNYIYIAIRRGPMKTPTSGTSVFEPAFATTGSPEYKSNTVISGFDSAITIYRPGYSDANFSLPYTAARLTGAGQILQTSRTNAEYFYSSAANFAYNTGWFNSVFGNDTNRESYMFKRAPSFHDVVCYTGTGVTDRVVTHNLGVAPELIITKSRSNAEQWGVGTSFGASSYQWLYLALTNSALNLNYSAKSRINSAPTSTQYTIATDGEVNQSTYTYVAYLFASCPGVSKVGSYTGTGALQTINCGFAAGARFVLIKRTDSTGDWWVYDSARGISSGNDPYLFLNSTAAEVTNTNYVDTASTGFQVTAAAPAGLNANGGTYIFLAIA
jgi:hypothetical protein